MKIKLNKETQDLGRLESLLQRVANRSDMNDAKLAAVEVRDFARSIQWVGPITKPGTIEMTEKFLLHLNSKGIK